MTNSLEFKKINVYNSFKERMIIMNYVLAFLEGVITFISPCLLPMIPIYVTYFAAGKSTNTGKVLKNSLGFVLGFTVMFVLMGALAGTLGSFLNKYESIVNIVAGLIVIVFGLNYIGVLKLNLFNSCGRNIEEHNLGFLSSVIFGIVFSVGWTPCVGVFLGTALISASRAGSTLSGILMLLSYSIGLGIPFILSAVLIDSLKGAFTFIKKNYRVRNIVCGILLIIIGIFMMTGTLAKLLGALS